MHRATRQGKFDVVCILLENGAEVKGKDREGKSAMEIVGEGNIQVDMSAKFGTAQVH